MRQYIYGKNTVMESLNGKGVYEVIISNQLKDQTIAKICAKKHIRVRYEPLTTIEKLVGKVNHQGVVLVKENYKYYSIDEIVRSIPTDKQPLLVLLDGLEDPHNLGAILRTCDAIGVDGVIIAKNRSVSLNATVAKVSTGAIDYVKVAQVTNLGRTIEDLKKQGFWIVGCDNDQSQDYRSIDYNMPLCIVIGSEGAGISRLVKEKCDYKVVLPMVGHVTSLNASVATAIILYQIHHSRFPL